MLGVDARMDFPGYGYGYACAIAEFVGYVNSILICCVNPSIELGRFGPMVR